MSVLAPEGSVLLLIDFQSRLMPAIHDGAATVANAQRLLEAGRLLEVPTLLTEQYPRGLGPTVHALAPGSATVMAKMTFDAFRAPGLFESLPEKRTLVVAGSEAHVCVLQTVLGLLAKDRQVYVVADAVGSRRPDSKDVALRRMERHGAEIATTEMVLFEWIASCEHPRFRDVLALVR